MRHYHFPVTHSLLVEVNTYFKLFPYKFHLSENTKALRLTTPIGRVQIFPYNHSMWQAGVTLRYLLQAITNSKLFLSLLQLLTMDSSLSDSMPMNLLSVRFCIWNERKGLLPSCSIGKKENVSLAIGTNWGKAGQEEWNCLRISLILPTLILPTKDQFVSFCLLTEICTVRD